MTEPATATGSAPVPKKYEMAWSVIAEALYVA
jgi:hypothetical protein